MGLTCVGEAADDGTNAGVSALDRPPIKCLQTSAEKGMEINALHIFNPSVDIIVSLAASRSALCTLSTLYSTTVKMLRLVVARNSAGARSVVPSQHSRPCRFIGRMGLGGRRSFPSSGAAGPGPIPNATTTHHALHDLPALSQVAKELPTTGSSRDSAATGPADQRTSKLLFGALENILEHYWGNALVRSTGARRQGLETHRGSHTSHVNLRCM